MAGFSNSGVAGYYAGGTGSGSNQTTVNKFAFPSDTQSTLGTGLSAATAYLVGNSNTEVAGYSGGGLASGTYTSTVNKFAFPSDTRTTLGTGLSVARAFGSSFCNEGAF
jgi:hypothetical protein